MCDSFVILRLYSCVLHDHKIKYGVTEADIRTGIQKMTDVYKPNPDSLSDTFPYIADYNDPGHRCAYLHKYAPFHTDLVAEMLERALQQNPKLFSDFINSSGRINICSLGGGPGTDILGVLSVLNTTYGFFHVSATIIDSMGKWKDMFHELVNELRYGDYEDLGECFDEQYFDWNFSEHNLLGKMTNQVNQAIGRANLVTMIKFVSAASCKDTSAMIRKIFSSMKPGALILFIENAGGGFHELVRKEAKKCDLESVFHQNHENYINSDLRVRKFGYESCSESRVSVFIWRKAFSKNENDSISTYSHIEQNFPPLSTIASQPPRKHETLNNRVSFSNILAQSMSKQIDIDHTNCCQETSYTKSNKEINNTFSSSEKNGTAFENLQGKLSESCRKTNPMKYSGEESVEYGNAKILQWIVGESVGWNQNGESVEWNQNGESVEWNQSEESVEWNQSEESVEWNQNEESVERNQNGESVEYGCNADFNQLDTEHKTSPATVSNLKNIKTFQYPRDKPPETRMTTNIRRKVAAPVSHSDLNNSASLRWVDRIREIFYQELIGVVTEELIGLFQKVPMNTITLNERFLLYLYESF